MKYDRFNLFEIRAKICFESTLLLFTFEVRYINEIGAKLTENSDLNLNQALINKLYVGVVKKI